MQILTRIRNPVSSLIKSERGNVESFLVLIPLVILFLLVFQLVIALYQRNVSTYEVQSIANRIAITGELRSSSDESLISNKVSAALHNSEAGIQVENQNMPGDGVLISVTKYVNIPIFTALFRDTKLGEFLRVRSFAYSEIN